MKSDSPIDIQPQIHEETAYKKPKKGFRRVKGESPLDFEMDIKMKKVNRHANFANPDPWARLIGRPNTAPIYINGKPGAQLSLIGRNYCLENNLEIQPLSKLIGCDACNGSDVEYEGYVEVNFQVPGRNFNEDHLFLVVPPIEYHKQVPAIVGTYILDSFVDHLKQLGQDTIDTLDISWKSMYHTRVETHRLRELHGSNPPLGFVRVTKATTIPAGKAVEIHGITKIKHGGYSVNLSSEASSNHPLPKGLKNVNAYCNLSPGSSRVNVMVENTGVKDVKLPAKAIICQLQLANIIPKLLFPHSDEDDCDKNIDSEDDFDLGQADLDDKDSGLTYGKVQTHQVIVEDLGEDLEADLNDSTIDDDVEETTVNNGTQLPQTVDSNPIARDRDSRSTTEENRLMMMVVGCLI